jgi:hypothetical protein
MSVLVLITAAVRVVTAMTAVHEMHEGTGEEQEIGHDAEHVRSVLSEQEEGRDSQESEQHQPGRQEAIHGSA